MRLKSLKLSGFKSFANTTIFTFKYGITAIVGPNGCGKSNVIDAIRWVLGESSAKQLRGGAMSDVIFAGTEGRAGKSLASVELTFEHTQDEQTGIRHELNLYHELSVRRQVTKDGKSDYFINGTRCRRRDVVDIFLGTGLGPRSYSVIQQGMIGRIVDSSPLQLREFIEEAAGVSRYQARRLETQKKLNQVSENLLRLNDIKSELSRRHNVLAKQAQNAALYQQLQAQLADVKYQLAVMQLYQAKYEQQQSKKAHEEYANTLAALNTSRSALSKKTDKLNEQLAQATWLKDKAQAQLHEQQLAKQILAHQLDSLQAKLTQTEAQLHSNANAQTEAHQDQENLTAKLEALTTQLAALSKQYDTLKHKRQQQQDKMHPLEQAWQHINKQLTKLQQTKQALIGRQALQTQAQDQLERQQNKWAQNHKALDSQMQALDQQDTGEFEARLTALTTQINSLATQQDDIADKLEAVQPRLNQIKHSLNEKNTHLSQLQKRHATIMGEYDTLHGILNNTAPSSHPAKPASPLDFANNGASANNRNSNEVLTHLPTLHDRISLTEKGKPYAQILDTWLTFWLDSRVTVSHDTQADILNVLLSYQPEDNLQSEDNSQPESNTATAKKKLKSTNKTPQAHLNAVHSVLFFSDNKQVNKKSVVDSTDSTDSIDNTNNLAQSVIAIAQLIATPTLDIWHQLYLLVAQDDLLNDADNLQKILTTLPKGSALLTASGWCITHSMAIHLSKLTGQNNGNTAQAGQLLSQRIAQQQRLEELEYALNDIEADIDAAEHGIKRLNREFEHLNIENDELKAQTHHILHNKHNLERQLTELNAAQQQQQSKLSYLEDRRQQLHSEQQELAEQGKTLATQQADIENQLNKIAPKLNAVQTEQLQLSEKREAYAKQQRLDNEIWQQLQVDINKLEHSHDFSKKQLATIDNNMTSLQKKQAKLQMHANKQSEQLPKLKQDLRDAESACHEQQLALEEHHASIEHLKLQSNQLLTQYRTLSEQIEQTQHQLSESNGRLAVANERIKEASERLDALNASVSANTNTNTPRPSASALLSEFIVHGRAPIHNDNDHVNSLQQTAQALTQKLAKIGAVNLAAVTELSEVEARLTPLTEQIDDIKLSITTLTDAITTIDAKTKSLFLHTLQAVNQDLSTLFTKVFGGGQATLSLIADDSLAKGDKWRAGLELMAQPKGKRNSRLAVLSGGEKTLTALSLIFAIFKQHPAPFCVLDEVDAPLDDANVARFTGLITDMATDVQFIFISHNKLAMQIADELKGVTMPQSGVSSLVSVSLAEAEQYLEV